MFDVKYVKFDNFIGLETEPVESCVCEPMSTRVAENQRVQIFHLVFATLFLYCTDVTLVMLLILSARY